MILYVQAMNGLRRNDAPMKNSSWYLKEPSFTADLDNCYSKNISFICIQSLWKQRDSGAGAGLARKEKMDWSTDPGSKNRAYPLMKLQASQSLVFAIHGRSNSHFRDLAESVKKGVLEAGGYPVEFPVMSLGETMIKPTAMLYRNLASMDVEESIPANPMDAVVLPGQSWRRYGFLRWRIRK